MLYISDTLIFLNSYSIYMHLHITFKITVQSMQHLKRCDKNQQLKVFLSKLLSIKGIV